MIGFFLRIESVKETGRRKRREVESNVESERAFDNAISVLV